MDEEEEEFSTITLVNIPQPRRGRIKQAMTGICSANCALCVVDARGGAFEASVGRYGELRTLLMYAFTHGLKSIIFAVNKMDQFDGDQQKERRFGEIRAELVSICRKVGFRNPLWYVPISIHKETNILSVSDDYGWWKVDRRDDSHGGGKCLIDLMRSLPQRNPRLRLNKLKEKPLRASIIKLRYRFFKSAQRFQIWCKVETGELRLGQEIYIGEVELHTVVRSLQFHRKDISVAKPGQCVSIEIYPFLPSIRSGFCIGDPSNDPPVPIKSFESQIIILEGAFRMKEGYKGIIHCRSSSTEIRLSKIKHKVDKRSGARLDGTPTYLMRGESGICVFEPPYVIDRNLIWKNERRKRITRKNNKMWSDEEIQRRKLLVLEDFAKYSSYGRFVVHCGQTGQYNFVGVVKKVQKVDLASPIEPKGAMNIPGLGSGPDERERRMDLIDGDILQFTEVGKNIIKIDIYGNETFETSKVLFLL